LKNTALSRKDACGIEKHGFMWYIYNMKIRQRTELRKVLAPQLRQSLKILTLPLLDLKNAIQNELDNNPFLEESHSQSPPLKSVDRPKMHSYRRSAYNLQTPDLESRQGLITKKASLRDILLRQLGIFADSDEMLVIGQEIIGNIDENGYLKTSLAEIAQPLNITLTKAENALKLIQQFEPAGVAARSVSECLLIQLELSGEKDPLIRKIVEFHLEDMARKNYGLIAKRLKEPLSAVEPLVKRILRLDPKPGRMYSAEETQHIVADIIINQKDDELEIVINNEDIAQVSINKAYQTMLKDNRLDAAAKEFLSGKFRDAMELLRAVSKRQETLRKIVESLCEIQADALKNDLSHLSPLTFKGLAQKINMHETTVCRAVMNKYVELPHQRVVVGLKDFFTSHIHHQDGQFISSSRVKRFIKELIEQEDKRHPLSDWHISLRLARERNLNVSRRTVAKYRDELRVLSSSFRRVCPTESFTQL
jgi:RNA polymerase sigma-54 factor